MLSLRVRIELAKLSGGGSDGLMISVLTSKVYYVFLVSQPFRLTPLNILFQVSEDIFGVEPYMDKLVQLEWTIANDVLLEDFSLTCWVSERLKKEQKRPSINDICYRLEHRKALGLPWERGATVDTRKKFVAMLNKSPVKCLQGSKLYNMRCQFRRFCENFSYNNSTILSIVASLLLSHYHHH